MYRNFCSTTLMNFVNRSLNKNQRKFGIFQDYLHIKNILIT